jgi:hypothetical protein
MLRLRMWIPTSDRSPRRGRLRARTIALGAALLLGTVTNAAAADEPSKAALEQARGNFSRALALQTAGDWPGALALLKQVAAVKDTPQVRFNIALCEEQIGQLVSALGNYEIAKADAEEQGAGSVADATEQRIESLRARIPRLAIQRGSGAKAASISIDGVTLGHAAVGAMMPLDPGAHEVKAGASGHRPFEATVQLAEGDVVTLEVTLEPLAPPPEPKPPAEDARDAGIERSSAWPYLAGGVGLAGLAVSGVFYGLRSKTLGDLDSLCPEGRLSCPLERADRVDELEARGVTQTLVGNIGLAVGAVGIGTAVVLWVLEPKSGGSAVTVQGGTAHGLAGVTLSGRF